MIKEQNFTTHHIFRKNHRIFYCCNFIVTERVE